MRKTLLTMAERRLPEGYDVEKHFSPSYNPWDQRVCLAPNGDLFKTIRKGKADVVTDTIERFTKTGSSWPRRGAGGRHHRHRNGFEHAAVRRRRDTATESRSIYDTDDLQGHDVHHMPNMAFTFGYTNASWTLKADLVSEFVCRVLNYMDANGFDPVEPQHPGDSVDERPFMDFTPATCCGRWTICRSPARAPWRLKQNYLLRPAPDPHGKVDDEALLFTKHHARR